MKKKALAIDDDVYCLDISSEFLTYKGFQVSSLLSPTCIMIDQKLETCTVAEPCYDIILSDNHMPKMTGLEFFVYQDQRGCKIPPSRKALISGNLSPKDKKMAESRGYKFFQKPTPVSLIDDWIDATLDAHS